ncbi:hypothetical protein D1BOALGB6SA_2605 [Olavius sp. associated proteobacterium Delta 1]|nr:hypothetical protein D1BOALGB6SA_2605 [Olavius sp. associated proteobacterium Delta 1]
MLELWNIGIMDSGLPTSLGPSGWQRVHKASGSERVLA